MNLLDGLDEIEGMLPGLDSPDPHERVRTIKRIRERTDELQIEAVREARANGATWQEIGAVYGITRQAAQRRFGTR